MVPQNIKPVLQRTAIEVSLALGRGVGRQPGPFPSCPQPLLGLFQPLSSLCVPRSWHGACGT